MVIVSLIGGLANQLYQYAVGRRMAHKLNTELKIDSKNKPAYKPGAYHGHYRLGAFNIQATLATPEEIERVSKDGTRKVLLADSDFENFQGDVFYPRLQMDEKYFADIRELLLQEITLKEPLSSNAQAWKEKILAADCSVSLHIRRGDFLNPFHMHIYGNLPLDYYQTCVAELKKVIPNFTVFVFSNDLKWVEENLKLDVPTEFVKGCPSDDEEFVLMSLCKHNIIANSGFSWWAAWLNQNPDKKIFSPDHRGVHRTHEIIFPERWTKIPVDYGKSLPDSLPPLLSVIFYVGNGNPKVALKNSGILNATVSDYELILIDDTAADNGVSCRDFEGIRRLTLIKGNKKIGKAAAYNAALNLSHGIFILFIDAGGGGEKNIYYRQGLNRYICDLWGHSAKALPDIIYFVRRLEENEKGNKVVEGIKDKRFSVVTEEQFKQTVHTTNLVDEPLQELKETAREALGASLGSKIFSRNFLMNNPLRFDEKLAPNIESTFLADALRYSKSLTIPPLIFYVKLQ